MSRRFAYFGIPHDAGTFSFYRALRAGLEPRGWEVFCVTVGDDAIQQIDPAFVDTRCVVLAPGGSPLDHSRAIAEWCRRERIEVVAAQHDRYALAALPHLDPEVARIHVCMDLFAQAFGLYEDVAPYVDRMIAATPRQRWELLRRGVPGEKLQVIPFAMDSAQFVRPITSWDSEAPLEIAWVARLNHLQKGTRFLPKILQRLDAEGLDYRLQVVGEGVDRGWLTEMLGEQVDSGQVRFHGRLRPPEVGDVLASCQIYLLPTRYEGFGISIVEAMAAGCAPVVTRLRGVTDWMIVPDETGVVCRLGSTREFAGAILSLARDRGRLEQMRLRAQDAALLRFSERSLGDLYAPLLADLLTAPRCGTRGMPWSEYRARAATYRRSHVDRVIPGRLGRWWLDQREIRMYSQAM